MCFPFLIGYVDTFYTKSIKNWLVWLRTLDLPIGFRKVELMVNNFVLDYRDMESTR